MSLHDKGCISDITGLLNVLDSPFDITNDEPYTFELT